MAEYRCALLGLVWATIDANYFGRMGTHQETRVDGLEQTTSIGSNGGSTVETMVLAMETMVATEAVKVVAEVGINS